LICDTQAAQEMDRMLDVFLQLGRRLRTDLASQGFWANAIDPRTGTALFDAKGAAWSEVTAARTLLKYPTRDAAACPVVVHPAHGTFPKLNLLVSMQQMPL
jgi:hypothetical protein